MKPAVVARRSVIEAILGFTLASVLGCAGSKPDLAADSEVEEWEPEPIDLPIPLLRRLHEIGELIDSRHPRDYDRGLGRLGLLLSRRLENGGYFCTPVNSLEFGGTGGDGVHFSLVEMNGAVTEDSPVVMTVPASSNGLEGSNAIVGSSLINFLRFGLLRGYFAMEQLIYQRDFALHAYSSPDWKPSEPSHESQGFAADETEKQILNLLASELNIKPLGYTINEFESLQSRYMPLLRFRRDW